MSVDMRLLVLQGSTAAEVERGGVWPGARRMLGQDVHYRMVCGQYAQHLPQAMVDS